MSYRFLKIILLLMIGAVSLSASGCGNRNVIREQLEVIGQAESGTGSVEAENNGGAPAESAPEEKKQTIYVYVCGAVARPGVYELEEGSRAYQAIEMAGGLLESADREYVNQAELLSDGQKLYIPTRDEISAGTLTENVNAADASASGKVNINKATKDELMTLPGIGESKADRILEYRGASGRFNSVEDIKNVQGIKDGVYDKIKDKITV